MSIVTLTTDFGDKDFYVGALKGTILRECGAVDLIDISHNIIPFDIINAGFVLKNAYREFPDNTVHIVTVNNADSRKLRYLLIKYQKQYFLGFDNGIFSLVFDELPDQIWDISENHNKKNTATLSTKSAFLKAVAHIIKGGVINEIGSRIYEIQQRVGLSPVVQNAVIRGSVIYIDVYDNVFVNITSKLFAKVQQQRGFVISFRRNERIEKISKSYYDVPEGEKLCLFNDNNYLEIAINSGKASSLLGLDIGDVVQINFT